MMDEIDKLKPEKIKPTQRCPKCHSLTLSFDEKTGSIRCSSCGFRWHLER